jgi:hypothetical protein
VQFFSLCSDNVIVEQMANLHGRNITGFYQNLLFDYAVSQLMLGSDFGQFLEANRSRTRSVSILEAKYRPLFSKKLGSRSRHTFWSDLMLSSSDEDSPAIVKIIGPAVIPESSII